MANYLSIIITAALVNNLVLVQLLGVSSLFYATNHLQRSIEFALFNFIVLFLAVAVNLVLYQFLLVPLELELFKLLCFVASSAIISTLLLKKIDKKYPLLQRQQQLAFFLSGGNSAILGTAIINTDSSLSILEGLAYGFGAALGYSLLIIAFAALRLRLENADVPSPFQGPAIQLITAGIIAISLLGFAGLS